VKLEICKKSHAYVLHDDAIKNWGKKLRENERLKTPVM
jgi:hypothetical protein